MNTEDKKDQQTEQQTEQKVATNVKSYFTREINEQITAMTMPEMEELMRDMMNSRQWIALLKYTSIRSMYADSILRSTNPIKDAHTISWAQGTLAGLSDIETYVIQLNAPRDEAESNEIESKINNDVLMGG